MDTKSPEFHSKYHSCESNLFLEFSSLNLLLHQESLQELMKFAMDLQADLNDTMAINIKPVKSKGPRSSLSKQLSVVSSKSDKIGK